MSAVFWSIHPEIVRLALIAGTDDRCPENKIAARSQRWVIKKDEESKEP